MKLFSPHRIKYKVIDVALSNKSIMAINCVQAIWNGFLDRLNLQLRVEARNISRINFVPN